jgi:hypothetical protein
MAVLRPFDIQSSHAALPVQRKVALIAGDDVAKHPHTAGRATVANMA